MMEITAVLRLKDEAQWLPLCLYTIKDLFDKIILCTQGIQTDDTLEICKEAVSDQIKHYHYQFDSRPNGPGFAAQEYNKYSRAYFYNWCFDKADTEWVCKWDGDMLALPSCKKYFQQALESQQSLIFKGIDVVEDFYHVGQREFCSMETRLYKKGIYRHGQACEVLTDVEPKQKIIVGEPLYVHTKWMKEDYSITKAWPKNWLEMPHFRELMKRKESVRKHRYRIPEEWLTHI